jgi:hypothetical protein
MFMKVTPRLKPSRRAKTISRLTAGVFFNDKTPDPFYSILRKRSEQSGLELRNGNTGAPGGPCSDPGEKLLLKKD